MKTDSQEALSELASRLKAAIRDERYEDASSLLTDYRACFDAAWSGVTADQRDALALEAAHLFAWAQRTAAAARSHLSSRMNRLPNVVRYQVEDARRLRSWELEG